MVSGIYLEEYANWEVGDRSKLVELVDLGAMVDHNAYAPWDIQIKSYFGQAADLRRGEWNAIKHIERPVLSFELLEEWEECLELKDRRYDEVCSQAWVVADLEMCDLRCLFSLLVLYLLWYGG